MEAVQTLVSALPTTAHRHQAPCQPLPLLEASAAGDAATVVTLLGAGADVNAEDAGHDNRRPLHWASEGGHVETVAALLSAGADVNAEDADQWTPLLCASH